MPTRKHFIAAAASVPLLAAAPPSPAPSASPAPAPKSKISQTALDMAARMRRFDAALTDKQIAEIARGIDGNLTIGRRVDPEGRALNNWDEPVTSFEVPA